MSQWEQMTKTQLINELEARGIWLERLGAIVDGSRDAILIGDEDSRFMLVNSAACELTGYSEEELLGMRFQDLLDESDLPAFKSHDQRIMVDGQTVIAATNIIRKDGTRVATEFSGGRFVIGGTPYKHAIARDITERKRKEEQLRLVSVIASQSPDALLATDLEFKIVFLNEAFKKLFGYSEAEVLGRTPDFLNAESLTADIQKEIYETVSSGGEWRGVALNRRKDGTTFPCELIAVPLADEEGRVFGYTGTQRDVTGRKRAEEERAATIDRLRPAR